MYFRPQSSNEPIYGCKIYMYAITNQTQLSILQRAQHGHCWLCVTLSMGGWVGQTIKNIFLTLVLFSRSVYACATVFKANNKEVQRLVFIFEYFKSPLIIQHQYTTSKSYGIFGKHNGNTCIWHCDLLQNVLVPTTNTYCFYYVRVPVSVPVHVYGYQYLYVYPFVYLYVYVYLYVCVYVRVYKVHKYHHMMMCIGNRVNLH